MVAFVQTPTATKARDRYRQSCLVGRLADNIGLRIRFDAGVDMPGGVWRTCTYVTRVLEPTALPATRSPPNFANEKPRDVARGFVFDPRNASGSELRLPPLAPAAVACAARKHCTEQPHSTRNWRSRRVFFISATIDTSPTTNRTRSRRCAN